MKEILQKFDSTVELMETFYFSQQMAENLINDLLDLAKLENNTFTFTNEQFNLMDIIYQAFKISQHTANHLNIELRAEIDCKENYELINQINGDKRRYLQIIMNFMSNALKFTDEGGRITVKIKILEN